MADVERTLEIDWRRATPPSLSEFDALAQAAFSRLPQKFRELCGDVVLHVADFADDASLRALGVENPFDLTGLYEGLDLLNRSVTEPPPEPARVHLYRLPILAEWIENGDTPLGDLIFHVLVHEIGHHFGFSDAQMHAIEEEN